MALDMEQLMAAAGGPGQHAELALGAARLLTASVEDRQLSSAWASASNLCGCTDLPADIWYCCVCRC